MAAVLALTCPFCGARGPLVIMYGPLISAEESDGLSALRDPGFGNLDPGYVFT